MLFDIIRDWFVMNIWGGFTADGTYYSVFGGMLMDFNASDMSPDDSYLAGLGDIHITVSSSPDYVSAMSLSDWLSTTSTIIVMVILCIIFGLMVRWLFRLTSGLLQGR